MLGGYTFPSGTHVAGGRKPKKENAKSYEFAQGGRVYVPTRHMLGKEGQERKIQNSHEFPTAHCKKGQKRVVKQRRTQICYLTANT